MAAETGIVELGHRYVGDGVRVGCPGARASMPDRLVPALLASGIQRFRHSTALAAPVSSGSGPTMHKAITPR